MLGIWSLYFDGFHDFTFREPWKLFMQIFKSKILFSARQLLTFGVVNFFYFHFMSCLMRYHFQKKGEIGRICRRYYNSKLQLVHYINFITVLYKTNFST